MRALAAGTSAASGIGISARPAVRLAVIPLPVYVRAERVGQCRLLAHHVDLGIDREGRYRRVTGPPGGNSAAQEAGREIAGRRRFTDWRRRRAPPSSPHG